MNLHTIIIFPIFFSYKTLEIVKPDGTSVLVTLDTATATRVLDGGMYIILYDKKI